MSENQLVSLGMTGWSVWAEGALRSAGFPATEISALAASAESVDYPAEVERLSEEVARVARDPRFREAVAWQNPGMLERCVDKVGERGAARGAVRRRRELKIVSYLQRYALKNDTIGFFGPVGWARLTADPVPLTVEPGDELVRQRRAYLEHWAVDALAQALAAEPAARPWLRPRVVEANIVEGDTVRLPWGRPVTLSPEEQRVLALCDGVQTAAEIDAYDVVDALVAKGVLVNDFDVPVVERPEDHLRETLAAIGDPVVRDALVARLDTVVQARDEVAAAAGDPDRLLAAMECLDTAFEQASGEAANRRPGEAYAGRRIVFEDTVRDVDVRLGAPLLDELAGPLGLVLDSARWFVNRVAEAYERRFDELYDALCARHSEISLAALLSAATPDLAFSYRELPPPVRDQVPELQRRWAAILAVPPGPRRHTLRVTDIEDAVRAAFPAAPPRWSSAVYQCPDVMLAAPSVAAVNRGEYQFVLGELHLATNTLEARVDVAQHPDPARLLAMDACSRQTPRVLPVPARASAAVNSRTYPPALLDPAHTYWTVHARHTGAPGPVLAGAGLTVHRVDGRLVVRSPQGQEWDLLEVFGEYLSAATMNGFKPVAGADHRPRISLDRLVLSRESWTFAPKELDWVFAKDPAARFRGAQEWRQRCGVPQRVFYRVAVEDKPIFADFASIALVNLFATAVRSAADEDDTAPVSLTELLPDLGQHWLTDAAGAPYTSELRLVAVPS